MRHGICRAARADCTLRFQTGRTRSLKQPLVLSHQPRKHTWDKCSTQALKISLRHNKRMCRPGARNFGRTHVGERWEAWCLQGAQKRPKQPTRSTKTNGASSERPARATAILVGRAGRETRAHGKSRRADGETCDNGKHERAATRGLQAHERRAKQMASMRTSQHTEINCLRHTMEVRVRNDK